MVTQLRSHLTAGLRISLICATALAVLGTVSAAGGTNKLAKKPVGAAYSETNDPAGNSVVVFDRFADGTLVKREAVGTGGNGSTQSVGCGPGCPILDSQNAVLVSRNGRFVVAVNAGSDTVSSFRETDSGLKLVDQQPSGGDMPESLALAGRLLYVLNVATANANGTTGNIYGFRITGDGHLTPVGSSQPLAHAAPPDHSADPRAIDIDPSGHVIVVTEIAAGFMGPGGPPGAIDTFVVGPDGKAGPAVSHPSSDGFPFGFAIDHAGHLVVSNLHIPDNKTVGSVSSYRLTHSGDVIPVDTKSSGGVLPCWVVIAGGGEDDEQDGDNNDGGGERNGAGRFAYVVNTGAGFPASVAGFGLSPGGTLTPVGSPAVGAGEFARTDAAASRDGKFLYVLSPQVGPLAVPLFQPSHIDVYAIGAGGSISPIGSTPASANMGIGATGLAVR